MPRTACRSEPSTAMTLTEGVLFGRALMNPARAHNLRPKISSTDEGSIGIAELGRESTAAVSTIPPRVSGADFGSRSCWVCWGGSMESGFGGEQKPMAVLEMELVLLPPMDCVNEGG